MAREQAQRLIDAIPCIDRHEHLPRPDPGFQIPRLDVRDAHRDFFVLPGRVLCEAVRRRLVRCFESVLFARLFFGGTFTLERRAFDRPMAIACFRFFTRCLPRFA